MDTPENRALWLEMLQQKGFVDMSKFNPTPRQPFVRDFHKQKEEDYIKAHDRVTENQKQRLRSVGNTEIGRRRRVNRNWRLLRNEQARWAPCRQPWSAGERTSFQLCAQLRGLQALKQEVWHKVGRNVLETSKLDFFLRGRDYCGTAIGRDHSAWRGHWITSWFGWSLNYICNVHLEGEVNPWPVVRNTAVANLMKQDHRHNLIVEALESEILEEFGCPFQSLIVFVEDDIIGPPWDSHFREHDSRTSRAVLGVV